MPTLIEHAGDCIAFAFLDRGGRDYSGYIYVDLPGAD